MKIEELIMLAEEITSLFPDGGRNISDSLELLSMYLDEIADAAISQSVQHAKGKNFEKNRALINMAEKLAELQAQLSSLTAHLGSDDDAIISEEEEDAKEEERIKRNLPNYADYAVDSHTPHNLNEDFTHTRVSAISICGKKYPVSSWQDALVTTCDVLAATDRDKFWGFLDDDTFRRRVNATFSRTETLGKSTKMRSMDIYVWTNISANQAKYDIRRLLMKYGIKISDYAVFLRADYTPLHTNYIKSEDDTDEPVAQDEKVGAFVRRTMRKLSTDNTMFKPAELALMQQEEWSKNTLGVTKPFLKKCVAGIPVFKQAKDEKGYNRYWNEVFKFNGEEYLVTSQWYEQKRSLFQKWLLSINEDKHN